MSVQNFWSVIERVLPDGGKWCTPEKAFVLSSLIVGLRPKVVVEVGVWLGGSLIPMAIAMKASDHGGKVIAIDPWNRLDSVQQQTEINVQWWNSVSHEDAYQKFMKRVADLELGTLVEVQRRRSDQADVPAAIDLLHIDGNHSDQAVSDVDRFACNVSVGGIVVMDDWHWEGPGGDRPVERAVKRLTDRYGCELMYELGTGAVFRKVISTID